MGSMEELIGTAGLIGVALIIFFESGFPFAFWLPGDSLLLTMGLFAARGRFDLWELIFTLFVSSVAGVAAGFWAGRAVGTRWLDPEKSVLIRREHIERARVFYARHGGKALVLGRFIPAVRSFIPFFAGIAEMPVRQLMVYNFLGGALWAIGLPVVGYYGATVLAEHGIDIDRFVLPVVGGIVTLFVVVPLVRALRDPETRARIFRRRTQ
jgi:membrane-associated protein